MTVARAGKSWTIYESRKFKNITKIWLRVIQGSSLKDALHSKTSCNFRKLDLFDLFYRQLWLYQQLNFNGSKGFQKLFEHKDFLTKHLQEFQRPLRAVAITSVQLKIYLDVVFENYCAFDDLGMWAPSLSSNDLSWLAFDHSLLRNIFETT